MKTIAQQIKWDFEANGGLVINDRNGNQIYYEDSSGVIEDNRPKPDEDLETKINNLLPKDESIKEMSQKFSKSIYFTSSSAGSAELGFYEGAKSMREYILRELKNTK